MRLWTAVRSATVSSPSLIGSTTAGTVARSSVPSNNGKRVAMLAAIRASVVS